MSRTIISIDFNVSGPSLEGIAATPIYPGAILKRLNDREVMPNDVEMGSVQPLVAVENRYKGIGISVPYAAGDTVYMRYCLPGDVFYGIYNYPNVLFSGTFLGCRVDGSLRLPPGGDLTDQCLVGVAAEYIPADEVYVAVEVM